MTSAVADREHAAPVRSATSERAVAFVAERRETAERLGAALVEHLDDPDSFTSALQTALASLSDPDYVKGVAFVAPGVGAVHGVRWPLVASVERGFRRVTRRERPARLLFLADRVLHEPQLETRGFAIGLLDRTIKDDPERTWQLLRRVARNAGDWITVDALAHPYSTGIAAERYRWAELEQLVFSPSRWERRLVGSTIATMTHGTRRTGRGPIVVEHGLPLLAQLIGDDEPDVQKALAWAYRSLAQTDPEATAEALRRETDYAVAHADGHRAWVIRDSLAKIDPGVAADLRGRLAGIRKRPGAPATSEAATTAAEFGALPDPIHHPEPPLA